MPLHFMCFLSRLGLRKLKVRKKLVTFGSALRVIRSDLTFRLYILGGIIGAIGYSQVMVTFRSIWSGVL